MKKQIWSILLALLLALCITPSLASADQNYAIQLEEHLPVTVKPGETISISFDLRDDNSYTWEDCVIILEDSYGLEISGCEGGAIYSNTGTKCYVQFKGLPVGSIYIHNRSEEEVRTGTVWFSETVPVDSFSIGNFVPTGADYWTGRVVGGDTYIGNYSWASSDYFWIGSSILPANHQDCYITKWTSSNESVAKIDGGGRILKLQAGKTTITATLSNGMVAEYDFVIVEPEQISVGSKKVITITPGEQCDFLLDTESAGQYVFYYDEIPDLWYSCSSELDPSYDGRNGYTMRFFELTPQDSPLYCSLGYPISFENGEQTETEPITVSVHFEKAVPVESIELISQYRKNSGIYWVDNSATFDVKTNPFLSMHEAVTYSSSDTDVISIREYNEWYLSCDFLAEGCATITATTASGVTTSLEIQVTKPFLSGENPQWTQYSMDNLNIEINSNVEISPSIAIDGHLVYPGYYTISPGSTAYSTIISIHKDYLQSLTVGTHEMWILGCGGEATTTITILEGKPPFTDVPADSFYYDPVMWAIEKGITNGLTATEFSPNATCNRAQVVTFLWRAAGSPEPETTTHDFVDVQAGSFYEKPVLWALENGITTGSDATHFNPTGDCNRAQVVTFIYRAFESPAVENADNPFTDVPEKSWYTAPVLWAVENGITNGLSATTFGPTQSCNRAQVVTFLYRAYSD